MKFVIIRCHYLRIPEPTFKSQVWVKLLSVFCTNG
jgi:hypothetical protein